MVDSAESTMLGRLKAMRAKIPVAIRNNPDLRILMSVNDFDKYDDELTQRESKNTSETDCELPVATRALPLRRLRPWPDDLDCVTPSVRPYDRRQPVCGCGTCRTMKT